MKAVIICKTVRQYHWLARKNNNEKVFPESVFSAIDHRTCDWPGGVLSQYLTPCYPH